MVKHQLSQRQSDYRPRYSILALVIAFFILPYFTDVGYYADQTPTHDAQESSKVGGKAEADYNQHQGGQHWNRIADKSIGRHILGQLIQIGLSAEAV